MAEEKKDVTIVRKKPKFLRNDWHKKIKLGSTVKKNRKWRVGRGIHSKLRLRRKGHAQSPSVGWGSDSKEKGLVKGLVPVRVENVADLKKITKKQGALVASVGAKKKKEILVEAKKMHITILNNYKEKQ